MKPDDIERLAKDHEPMPKNTALPDACFYWTMRALYDSLRAGRITRDEAVQEKRHIVRQYMEFKAAFENQCRVFREEQERIRKSELLRTEITKSDSIAEKLRFAVEAIGAMTGDTVFMKTELAKLEGLHDDRL